MNPQPFKALEAANDVRFARAELRRRIAAGEIMVASVLLDPPPEATGWRIELLLQAQPRWGRVRAVKLLERQQISEHRPLRALTPRQRRLLAELVGGGKAAR